MGFSDWLKAGSVGRGRGRGSAAKKLIEILREKIVTDLGNMETAWLEIVETSPGKIELRRELKGDEDGVLLLRMEFTKDSQTLLGEHLGEVARTMIAAGLQVVSELYQQNSYTEPPEPSYTLH